MHELIIATRNSHKTHEFAALLGDRFVISDVAGRDDIPLVEETGETFAENAVAKAVGVSGHVSALVAADDSGLEVDALHGAPGVYSARYAGRDGSDAANVAKLIAELRTLGKTTSPARFRCVIGLARNGALLRIFEGTVDGVVTTAPDGDGGFGYDPVFIPNGYDATFAALPPATKNSVSHRARAVMKLREFLEAGGWR